MNITRDSLRRLATLLAGLAGAITLGGLAGLLLGGPIGGIVGMLLGAWAGSFAGFMLYRLLYGKKPGVRARIVRASLHANPPIVSEGDICFITIQFEVDGNQNGAECEISWLIHAEQGDPPTSIGRPPILNNASSFGRHTHPLITRWHEPHDGRLITGHIFVSVPAANGAPAHILTFPIDSIRVTVNPR